MECCELLVIRQRRDLGDAGQRGIAPARARCAEPGETALEESAIQRREPAGGAVDRVLETRTPATRAQARMTGDAPTTWGAAIEVERVHVREADEVADRLAMSRRSFPVDDARD